MLQSSILLEEAIMSILEREIRMAGYEFRDDKGINDLWQDYAPLVITDSGNKCCDEVTIIYDEVFDTLKCIRCGYIEHS